jgi:hypothetical protein
MTSSQTKVFLPTSKFKTRWDACMSFLIFYSLFVIPFRIAFHIHLTSTSGAQIFDDIVDICFAMDMIFTFFTAYEDPTTQLLVTDVKQISKRYLSTWFIADLMSTVPFDSITPTLNPNLMRSLKLIRLFRLGKLLKVLRVIRMKRKIQVNAFESAHPVVYALITLCVKILFIAHFSCCIFYGISPCLGSQQMQFETDYEAWLQCGNDSWQSRYVLGMYWTLLTMLGIGYGDVTLSSNSGRVFSIAVMGIGSIVFGFMVASISDCVKNLDPRDMEKKIKMDIIRGYIQDKDITDKVFRNKLWTHFEYYYTHLVSAGSTVNIIAQGMPPMMQKQLLQ